MSEGGEILSNIICWSREESFSSSCDKTQVNQTQSGVDQECKDTQPSKKRKLRQLLEPAKFTMEKESEIQTQFDKLRSHYLNVFEKEKNPLETLRQDGKIASEIMSRTALRATESKDDYNIWYNDSLYSFTAETTTILVGKHKGCDILLPQNNSTSRVAIVIYLSRQSSEIFIMDPGCLAGFTLKVDDLPSETSKMKERCRRFCFWSSSVVLTHGSDRIILQPKLCAICMERPKSFRLDCGHQCVCGICSGKVLKDGRCPLCRSDVRNAIEMELGVSFQCPYNLDKEN